MNKSRKRIFIAVAVLLVLGIILSVSLGAVCLTPAQLVNAIKNGSGSGLEGNIFWYVRVPRTIACLLAGAGLAVSGVVIQSVLSNKLASPGIIGVNAGAGFAVTVCCALGALSGWALAGSAFIGALLAVLLVVGAAQKMNASRTTVILGGVAVNSFLNAGSEAIITLFPDIGVMSSDFRVGGFTSVTMTRLLPAGILILIGLCVLFTLCNELDLMNLGEETAQGLGLPVKKMRTIFLAVAALLAGASVSFAGLLGFVGLIIPHIARRLVGGENRHLLPFCAIGGAAFVVLCDLAARLVFQPYEIPVGILMSFIGGPFFVFLLFKNKGGHRRD
ncbi:MAG: iron ABC transporter permease [Tyzzerella sp.]|nr:iron ABC transporter permease [Tyzzerella sp.]